MHFNVEHKTLVADDLPQLSSSGEFDPDESVAQGSERRAGEESLSRRRVLVVDDERLLADTTAAILRRAGFEARTAYGGWEALEIVKGYNPDYLLTDVMMPMMNGMELAMAVSKMSPSTAILLSSGQAGVAPILEDAKAKGYEFPLLAKPVHPSKVVERLRELGSASH
ncbi:response regulator [Terriglobus aquaticus]|uniref:Response regulator n=1 Tax=Terriglobus aquaticus TaxID=940139 RepID=A0ABW9KM20_9BACT|nr:response regulator [Terriglobus aquaticus]